MEKKKTKLTISGKPKKSFKNFDNKEIAGKKTVFIDKKPNKVLGKGFVNKTGGFKQSISNFKKAPSLKNNFPPKTNTATSDFERRKLAEQRATKRLKGDSDNEKKSKTGIKKRELKLTVSRALSDQIETRERSLASVKRARLKEKKNQEVVVEANLNQQREQQPPLKTRDNHMPDDLARLCRLPHHFWEAMLLMLL